MRTVLISSLDAATGVADKNLDPFVASEIWLVALLDAEVAGVVAGGVVVVALDVVGRDLAYVAEYVGCGRVVILPEDAFLYEESGETVEFLLKASVVL